MIKKIIHSFAFVVLFCFTAFAATTTDKISYGTSTSLSCGGAASMASSQTSAISCVAIDNTSNLAVDYLITVSVTTSASALGSDKAVYIYSYASEDGSNYELEESSSPSGGGAYTLNSPNGFKNISTIPVVNTSKQYTRVFSLANAYGGVCPRKWGLIIENFTGQALTGFSATYTPINYQNQ